MSDSAHDLDAPSKTDPVQAPPTDHGPAAGEDAGLPTPGPDSQHTPTADTAQGTAIDAGDADAGASAEVAPTPDSEPVADQPESPDQAPDLEEQVETLLAEVSQTVEEIQHKLADDDPARATTADQRPAGPDAASPAVEPTAQPGSAPQPQPETQPESIPSEPAPTAGAASGEPEESTTVGDVQAALQDAIADEPVGAPAANGPAPAGVTPESITDELTPPSATEPTAEADDAEGDADNGYGGTATLDDELAALASHALDDDLEGSFDDEPTADAPTEAVPAATTDTPADAESIATAETPEPAAAPATPVSQPADTAQPVASVPGPESPSPEPAGPLRWGWLPPKPDWPQCYSRLRPVVIAWRHAVWIIPPLVRHLLRLAAPHARRAEPKVRHAVAVAASPLSKRDRRTRSAIGWLACNTLFWGACLWVWIFWARSPAVPELSSPPTSLQSASELQASADSPD